MTRLVIAFDKAGEKRGADRAITRPICRMA